MLSGIAWDHINVFPTFEIYVDQFRSFKDMISETLIYFSEDKELNKLVKMELPELGDKLRNSSEHMVITDDNMICEYPRKRSYWIEPKNSWGTMLRNLRKDP